MTQSIIWLKDVNKELIAQVGSKAAFLGELLSLSLPVPEGFVITTEFYNRFCSLTGLKKKISFFLEDSSTNNLNALNDISKKIQQAVISTPFPEELAEEILDNYELLGVNSRKAQQLVASPFRFVAVRGSAVLESALSTSETLVAKTPANLLRLERAGSEETAPSDRRERVCRPLVRSGGRFPIDDSPDIFAGKQTTFLNVRGEENLLRAVKQSWASLFSFQGLYFQLKKNLPSLKVIPAVLVQIMVDAVHSGILFTTNPSGNQQEFLIEAVHGLGEAITAGKADPDCYVVDKQRREIKTIKKTKQEIGMFCSLSGSIEARKISPELQARKVLADTHIQELTRLGRKIEKHFCVPQDIGWAVSGNQVFIVQARPMRNN